MFEKFPSTLCSGRIRVFEQNNPNNILFDQKNVITLNTKYLFARLLSTFNTAVIPAHGVWGLAVGAGAPDWPDTNQPATADQTGIITELKRKRLQSVRFVDVDLNPLPTDQLSNRVDFQTVLNATTDSIETPIRELGLIGGGTSGTDMLTAPYFSRSTPSEIDSVVLINYKTLPPLRLPDGINFIFSWILEF